jgi:hypothetical protein
MKVFLHYEDNENSEFHKSIKITLPKSWKTGPASNLVSQFVESYNAKFQEINPLTEEELHLSIRKTASAENEKTEMASICSDAVVIDEIADRAAVYICHGPSTTKAEQAAAQQAAEEDRRRSLKNSVACTHFGCQQRFPKGGPYPECQFHKLPPVFHETAKFWSCCPTKKAYDWDSFQKIAGCETGICSEVKEEGKLFLGGSDVREKAAAPSKLKSIDDFNSAQSAGGADAAPVLERLQRVMQELGIEKELFDQVLEGMKKEHAATFSNDAELLAAISKELGDKLKSTMKAIAADQLRIK